MLQDVGGQSDTAITKDIIFDKAYVPWPTLIFVVIEKATCWLWSSGEQCSVFSSLHLVIALAAIYLW